MRQQHCRHKYKEHFCVACEAELCFAGDTCIPRNVATIYFFL